MAALTRLTAGAWDFVAPLRLPGAALLVLSAPLAPSYSLMYSVIVISAVIMLGQRIVSRTDIRQHEARESADRKNLVNDVLATGRSFDAMAGNLMREVKAVKSDVEVLRGDVSRDREEREKLYAEIRALQDHPILRAGRPGGPGGRRGP